MNVSEGFYLSRCSCVGAVTRQAKNQLQGLVNRKAFLISRRASEKTWLLCVEFMQLF